MFKSWLAQLLENRKAEARLWMQGLWWCIDSFCSCCSCMVTTFSLWRLNWVWYFFSFSENNTEYFDAWLHKCRFEGSTLNTCFRKLWVAGKASKEKSLLHVSFQYRKPLKTLDHLMKVNLRKQNYSLFHIGSKSGLVFFLNVFLS